MQQLSHTELRRRLVDIKVEKAQTEKELSDINARISNLESRKSNSPELVELRVERAELVADKQEQDSELTLIGAHLYSVDFEDRDRESRLHHIRTIACALLSKGCSPESAINDAQLIEKRIQALIPIPKISIDLDA
jgi:chromosome segregation ATPase